MKKTILFLFALAGLASSSQAASILSDDFTYPDGAIVGAPGSPWLNNTGAAGTSLVTNNQLLVSTSRAEDIAAPVSGGPYMTNGAFAAVYSKFTVKFTGLPTAAGAYFAHFNGETAPPSATLHRARIWTSVTNAVAGTLATAGKFRLGIVNSSSGNASTAQWDADLDLDVTYTIVTRLILATGASTLWIDPTDESSPNVTAADPISPLINVTYYSFRQANGEGSMAIDSLRVGTAFSDVAGADTAPTISAIPNQAIPQDGNTSALPFIVGDAESAASSLTVLRSSTNTTLVPLVGIVINDGDGTNRTVTVTPASGQQGQTLISLTVSDSVNTAQSSFVLTVGAPTISTIPNQITVSNVPTAAIPFTVADSETSPASLTVFVSSASNPTLLPPGNILLGGSGSSRTISLTPAANEIGVSTITVSVTDGINTNSSTFRLSVTPLLGVLLSDDFNYSSFLFPNALLQAEGSPWLHASGAIPYELQVTNGICYLDSAFTEDLTAQLTNSPYGSSNGIVYYAGFTLNCTTLPTQAGASSYFAHFKDSQTGTTFRAKVFAETNNAATGKFRLGVANNGNGSTQFPQDLEVGVTYSVVTRYASGIGEASLWVNPVSESSQNITGTDALQTTPIGHYALRQDSGFGVIELGKLKIATSFNEALAIPAPAPEPLQFQLFGSDLVLSWTNSAFKLQASPLVSGTYTNITGGSSPYTNSVTASQKYFRLHYP